MTEKFWWCLNHKRSSPRRAAPGRTGSVPTTTEAEAARALEKVKERNEEWDNDPEWNDKDLAD